MNPITLGQRIREQRKKHRLTSEQLGELCDVGAVHIRKIESGAKVPSLNLFLKLLSRKDVRFTHAKVSSYVMLCLQSRQEEWI